MRDSAIMYRSFYESGQCLPEAERLKLYEAIFEYSFNGKVVELDGVAKPILMLIMPLLEANMKRYENGKKPKQKQKGSKKEAKPKRTRSKAGANVYVNKDENEYVNKDVNKETILSGFFSSDFLPEWERYIAFRKKQHKFSYQDESYEKLAVQELFNLSSGNEALAKNIINQTISKGWKGLFALKTPQAQPTQHQLPLVSTVKTVEPEKPRMTPEEFEKLQEELKNGQ